MKSIRNRNEPRSRQIRFWWPMDARAAIWYQGALAGVCPPFTPVGIRTGVSVTLARSFFSGYFARRGCLVAFLRAQWTKRGAAL